MLLFCVMCVVTSLSFKSGYSPYLGMIDAGRWVVGCVRGSFGVNCV